MTIIYKFCFFILFNATNVKHKLINPKKKLQLFSKSDFYSCINYKFYLKLAELFKLKGFGVTNLKAISNPPLQDVADLNPDVFTS